MAVASHTDLRELGMARVVGELARQNKTGVLEIVDTVGTSRAFFLNGVPQGARSARLTNPIGQLLVQQGVLTPEVLSQALEVHNRTDKLVGQILLDMKLVTPEVLNASIAEQSRKNFLALFSLEEGRVEFQEGLVHLADFTPAPSPALLAIYEGVRDHGPTSALNPFLARLAFSAVKLAFAAQEATALLGPAEQIVVKLLTEYRLAGDLARRVPLQPRALGALLLALDELGLLELAPALKAR